MNYTIEKSIFGAKSVLFNCARCGEGLKSPLEDAGQADKCPVCQQPFTVPGKADLEADRELAKFAEATKATGVKKPKHHPAPRESLPMKASVEQVWYGAMICSDCGYSWQARRKTPPAKCPGCSRRSAEPVMEAKRSAAGCAIAIAVGGIGLTAVAAKLLG